MTVSRGVYIGFLSAPGDETAQVELTYNWDPEDYGEGRNFGHLAYAVEDIYALCQRLLDHGVTINRPPRDGRMAFVRSPIISPLNYYSRENLCPLLNPGYPWKTQGTGDTRLELHQRVI